MLNNKGQSLILFIVILPILLVILVLIIDVGKIISRKQEVDNINKIVVDYGVDKIYNDDLNFELLKEELKEIVYLNNSEIDDIQIELENDKLYIEMNLSVKGMLSNLIDISIFDINSSYIGYIENGNKRIERIRGD